MAQWRPPLLDLPVRKAFQRLSGRIFGLRSTRLSGSTEIIWQTVIDVPLADDPRPSDPSFLVITIDVAEGIAGVGWYDDAGLAEEIFVSRSPRPQRISLTVWNPKHCQRLIIRNVQSKNVSAELVGVAWCPITRSTLNRCVFANVNCGDAGFFMDQPFRGTCAELLWKSWRENRFGRVRKYRALKRLVWLAWQRCPGYHDFWKSHGWHPSYLHSLEDVHGIPIISKDRIRSNVQDFTVERSDLSEFTTSGTTGLPFAFKYTPLLNAAHQGGIAIAATYGDPDLLPWQQRALIIKHSARGAASATGPGGSLFLNAAVIHDADLLRQLTEAYRPTLLFGWPSLIGGLAHALAGQYEFRIAILGSENVFDSQVAETSRVARTTVGTYGLSEGAGFAIRCHRCSSYAELDTHGIISFQKRADGLFDIIGTSFWSRGTLFIRYHTGDITPGLVERCPSCPDSMHYFKRPTGRTQDLIIDRHGTRHPLAMLVGAAGVMRLLKSVQLFDFVQATPGLVLFRYATTDGIPIDEGQLIAQFQKLVGDEFVLTCRYDARILDLRTKLSPAQKWTILKQTDF
jgi:hypothetical protein